MNPTTTVLPVVLVFAIAGGARAAPATSEGHPVVGSGDHMRVGQELYAHICAACHGISGLGQSGTGVPRIAGQHYPYVRRQIETASVLHEELHPPQMLSAIRSMRPQEKEALADYISRLGNSDALLDSNRPAGTGSHSPPP